LRAAPELLGAQTIGGGSAWPGVVVERFKEVKYAFQAARNVRKQLKNDPFASLIDLKTHKNAVFT
jgi:hypothetical protein